MSTRLLDALKRSSSGSTQSAPAKKKSSATTWIIVAVVAVVLIVVTIVILVLVTRNRGPNNPNNAGSGSGSGTIDDACTTAADCAAGTGCVVDRCAACTNGSHCRPGEACNAGTCGPCTTSANCAGSLGCVSGECTTCTDETHCAGTQICVNGVCKPCANNGECPTAGEVCISGACQNCTTSTQCGGTLGCVSGLCGACTGPGDCVSGTCISGECCLDLVGNVTATASAGPAGTVRLDLTPDPVVFGATSVTFHLAGETNPMPGSPLYYTETIPAATCSTGSACTYDIPVPAIPLRQLFVRVEYSNACSSVTSNEVTYTVPVPQNARICMAENPSLCLTTGDNGIQDVMTVGTTLQGTEEHNFQIQNFLINQQQLVTSQEGRVVWVLGTGSNVFSGAGGQGQAATEIQWVWEPETQKIRNPTSGRCVSAVATEDGSVYAEVCSAGSTWFIGV